MEPENKNMEKKAPDIQVNNGPSVSENNAKCDDEFSNAEYFASLEKWLHDMYILQHINYFVVNPFMQSVASSSVSSSIRTQPLVGRGLVRRYGVRRTGYIECRIPPIWKRLAAEFIDFILLFIVKLIATYFLVDFLEFTNWSRYDFDNLIEKTIRLDYNAAMELTTELMLIEIAHRVTVCLYEAFWIYRGVSLFYPGSTPGKLVMNLKVVHCEQISTIREEPQLRVMIKPGTNLPLFRAIARSVIKNIILAVFLPFTFLFMFFNYNRTGYDILSQSVVIEIPTGRGRRR